MRQTKVGRYELLHKIAAGGMAEVFLARHWGHGGFFRDVVIKRLFAHYAEHEHALRMFQDEARLLAELSHPNIPQVYELGYDGHWYLAMEHVAGVSLADLCLVVTKERPMPPAVAIGIIAQVCAALHHAHEQIDRHGRPLCIVHRDVTPYNVMVSPDAVVKVLDFGVAQTSARTDTDTGAVRGTYAYMAPEQVRGQPLDRRADVFALGINLYELTTGTRLFQGSDVEVMTAVVEKDVPVPSSLVPNYPPGLEDIVMRALRRDPSARIPSAGYLLQNLDQFCLRNGLSTSPINLTPYLRSLFRDMRHPEPKVDLRADSAVPTAFPVLSEEELEKRLVAQELETLRMAEDNTEEVTIELDGSSQGFMDDEETEVMDAAGEGRPSRSRSGPVHFGLDVFDEDSDVKPVVLLSPKTPAREVAFLGDLQRRLEEDPSFRKG